MSIDQTSRPAIMTSTPIWSAPGANQPPHPVSDPALSLESPPDGVTPSRPAICAATPTVSALGGNRTPHPTRPDAAPIGGTSGGDQPPYPANPRTAPSRASLGTVQSPRSTKVPMTPKLVALSAVEPPRPANGQSESMVHAPGGVQAVSSHVASDAQSSTAADFGLGRPAMVEATPKADPLAGPAPAPFRAGRQLAFTAKTLDDIEAMRTAAGNRLRTLTRGGPADERLATVNRIGYGGPKFDVIADLPPDKDDEERGFGLSEDDPAVELLIRYVASLDDLEQQAIKTLERQMRKHPLGPWAKAQKGVGDKQCARLLAALGDPYIRPEIVLEDGTVEPSRPRMVSELISYAGWLPGADGGPAPRRRRGELANWNAEAKKRTWLVVESSLKQTAGKRAGTCVPDDAYQQQGDEALPLVHADGCDCSPYRVVYDDVRRLLAAAAHATDCPQCHAKAGDLLKPGHQKARAMRLAARQLIKDLWAEARRIHLGEQA